MAWKFNGKVVGARSGFAPVVAFYGHGSAAFSLVEVALALGVVAFAIVSIMGLMAGSLSVARESGHESAVAAIVRSVADDLRGRPFAELPLDRTEIRYFHKDGSPCPQTNDVQAKESGAVYKVTVLGTADERFNTVLSGSTTVNLIRVALRIQGNGHWPPLSSESNRDPNEESFYFHVARR